MKVVINRCYGGFDLSDAAHQKLIEWGVPVRKYTQQQRDDATGRFLPEPLNDGEIIFDNELTLPGENEPHDRLYHAYKGRTTRPRYWDTWTRNSRSHPMIVRLVEEMGAGANGPHAELKVIEIPDGIEYEIEEYDGMEWIAEVHRTWR